MPSPPPAPSSQIGYYIEKVLPNGWHARLEMIPSVNSLNSTVGISTWIEMPEDLISMPQRNSPNQIDLPEGILNTQEAQLNVSLVGLYDLAMELGTGGLGFEIDGITPTYHQKMLNLLNSIVFPSNYIDMKIDYDRSIAWTLGWDMPQTDSHQYPFASFASGTDLQHIMYSRQLHNTWIYYEDEGQTLPGDTPDYICHGIFVQKPSLEITNDLKDVPAWKTINFSDAIQYIFEQITDWDLLNILDNNGRLKILMKDLMIDIVNSNYIKSDLILDCNNNYISDSFKNICAVYADVDYLYQQLFYYASLILYKYVLCYSDYKIRAVNYTISDTTNLYFLHPLFYHQFYKQLQDNLGHNQYYIREVPYDYTPSDNQNLDWQPNAADTTASGQTAYRRDSTNKTWLMISYCYTTAALNAIDPLGLDSIWNFQYLNFGGLLSVNSYDTQSFQEINSSSFGTALSSGGVQLVPYGGGSLLNVTADLSNQTTFTTSAAHGYPQNSFLIFQMHVGLSVHQLPTTWQFLIGQTFLVDVINPTQFHLQFVQKPNWMTINGDSIESKYKNFWDFIKNQYNSSGGMAQIIYLGYAGGLAFYFDLKDTQDLVAILSTSKGNSNLIDTKIEEAQLIEHHALLRGCKTNLENQQQNDDSNPEYVAQRSYADKEGDYSVPIWNGYSCPLSQYTDPNGDSGDAWSAAGHEFDYGNPLLARKIYYFDVLALVGATLPFSTHLKVDLMRYKRAIINGISYFVDNQNYTKTLYTSLTPIAQPVIQANMTKNEIWQNYILNPLQNIQKSSGYGRTLNMHKMKNFARFDQFLISGKTYINYNLAIQDVEIKNFQLDPIYCGNIGQIFTEASSPGFENDLIIQFPNLKNDDGITTNYNFILLSCQMDDETKIATLKLFFLGTEPPLL